jgi:hypothetical protein
MRWWLTIPLLVLSAPAMAADSPPDPIGFFENYVRPVLAEHCYSCHGPKKQSAGLRLDTAAGLKAGADSGPVVVPGDPARSKLIAAINRQGDYPMPPKQPLPAEAVARLTQWVKAGAVFPADQAIAPKRDPRQHWAFQALRPMAIPQTASTKSANPIDAFVLARLEAAGLRLSPIADRRTLIRRAYFDLLGLPPTIEEVESFVHDESPDAWDRLIDRLLASPHYGERWARYWLDVARYADTKGYVFNEDRNYPFAYTYRDYVIRSFNEDKPFDRFVLEQLAADRLPLGEDKQALAALGFLTLGRRFLNNIHDIIDDRIDVVTRGLMGLTVQCARCHDHKYDPVPQADYYSLYGIFASTNEPKELPLIQEVKRTPEVLAFETELAKRRANYQAEVEKRFSANLKKLREPASIADYLRAVLESRRLPEMQVQSLVRQRDLRPAVFNRWKNFVTNESQPWSPVYSPLLSLAELPEKDFPTQAAEVLAQLATNPKKPVNPIVLQALRTARPQSLKTTVEAVAARLAAPTLTVVGPPSPHQLELARAVGPGGPLDIPLSDAESVQTRADRDALAAMKQKIDAYEATNPAAPPRAHVLADNPQPTQPVVFLRGNPGNRGPVVPRQAPAIVMPNRKPFTEGSGRLELARAIVSPENPLTARVFVNRVWIGHFGQGLVRTPSDFGLRSEPPTHPELLDWLALRFIQEGWSIKKLHKLIMTSQTYQQMSTASSEVFKLDPDNRLLARQNRRRLDFEAMRDSFLAVSGKLDRTLGGKPVDLFKAPFSSRRSIYGLIDRTNFSGILRTFDVAIPDQHSPQRYQTTVPQQALFLMNSPFLAQQAKALATRPEVTRLSTPEEKMTMIYRLALNREPTREERAAAVEFLDGHWLLRLAEIQQPFGKLPQLAQVILLSNEFAFVD